MRIIIKNNIYLLISCFSIAAFVFGIQCAFYTTAVNHSSEWSVVGILFPVFAFLGMILAPVVGSTAAIISLFIERKRFLRILFVSICLSINLFFTTTLFFPYIFPFLRG